MKLAPSVTYEAGLWAGTVWHASIDSDSGGMCSRSNSALAAKEADTGAGNSRHKRQFSYGQR